jgi:hypothetical protein
VSMTGDDRSPLQVGSYVAGAVQAGNRTTPTPNPFPVGAGSFIGGLPSPPRPGLPTTQPTTQAPGLGANATPFQVLDYVYTNYPGVAAFFNVNPEVRDVLTRAAREGWAPGKLQFTLQGTSWWKQTSSSARQWDLLLSTDPAEARRQAAATAASVQNSAKSLGLPMSAGQIAGVATTATRNGWTDEQVIDNLLRSLNWSSVQGGDLTAYRDRVKSIGGQFLVKVSDSTAQNYAARIASGELSEAGVASIMQAQARARFAWMRDVIDQGITPEDYLRPVKDMIADTLEVAPESIDLLDPKWLGMAETRDPKTGELRAATLNEAMLAARKKPEWARTRQAQELTAGLMTGLSEAFGLRSR